MFKRSANNALRAGLFALAVAMPSVALADPLGPLVMDPTYAERVPVARVAGCAVTIAGLDDNRRAPQTIGIVAGFRSIEAPVDREAWFRSVVETGLRVRGFAPTVALVPAPAPAPVYEAPADAVLANEPVATEAVPPAAGPDVLTVRVGLQSVWLASLGMNKTGSVVLHLSAAHGTQSKDAYYRGEYVSPNWASGRGEFNEHLDRTFAEALNALAADLAPLCNGAP